MIEVFEFASTKLMPPEKARFVARLSIWALGAVCGRQVEVRARPAVKPKWSASQMQDYAVEQAHRKSTLVMESHSLRWIRRPII